MKKLFFLLLIAVLTSLGIVIYKGIVQSGNNSDSNNTHESNINRAIREQREFENRMGADDIKFRENKRNLDSIDRTFRAFRIVLDADSAYYSIHHKYHTRTWRDQYEKAILDTMN